MAEDLNIYRQTMTAIETMKDNPSFINRAVFELPVEEFFQLEEEEYDI